jgi:hypothetical protein
VKIIGDWGGNYEGEFLMVMVLNGKNDINNIPLIIGLFMMTEIGVVGITHPV